MEDDFEKMSEDELNAIIRKNENSYVPTSRFNRAKNELEIRHRKNIEESSRHPKVSIVTGNVQDSIISGNTVHFSNKNNTETPKESFLSKFFWQVIVALIVLIAGTLILKHFFGI